MDWAVLPFCMSGTVYTAWGKVRAARWNREAANWDLPVLILRIGLLLKGLAFDDNEPFLVLYRVE